MLQISTTVHMALVQGIYDLGEPGREADKTDWIQTLEVTSGDLANCSESEAGPMFQMACL